MYCEDFPCCGHTDMDPCPGRSVVMEPWYCDDCGVMHYGECEYYDGWDEEEEEPPVDDDFPMSMEYPMEDQYLDTYMEDMMMGGMG